MKDDSFVRRNPVPIALGAFAVGLGLAFLLRFTGCCRRAEDEQERSFSAGVLKALALPAILSWVGCCKARRESPAEVIKRGFERFRTRMR